MLQGVNIVLIWQGCNWIQLRSQGMKEVVWADLTSCWYSICVCMHTLFVSSWCVHMAESLSTDVWVSLTWLRMERSTLCLTWYIAMTSPISTYFSQGCTWAPSQNFVSGNIGITTDLPPPISSSLKLQSAHLRWCATVQLSAVLLVLTHNWTEIFALNSLVCHQSVNLKYIHPFL